MQVCDHFEIRNKKGELYDCPRLVPGSSFQSVVQEGGTKAEPICLFELTIFPPHSLLFLYICSFETTVGYFGMKPKSGEKEITPNYVFMVWYEFCSDFKTIWKRESKNISKER